MQASLKKHDNNTVLIEFNTEPTDTVISAIKKLINVTVTRSSSKEYLVVSSTAELSLLAQKILMALKMQSINCSYSDN